jgi:hypothetical protein
MSKYLDYVFWSSHKHFANVIKDLEWRANIHGAKEHEARGDLEGGGLL